MLKLPEMKHGASKKINAFPAALTNWLCMVTKKFIIVVPIFSVNIFY